MLYLILIVALVIVGILFAFFGTDGFWTTIGVGVSVALAVVLTFFMSLTIVEPGTVVFTKFLGNMTGDTYTSGTRFLNPIADRITENIRRQAVDFTGDTTAEGMSANKVVLRVDATVPYILNPGLAWRLYERYGEKWNLITPAARKAVRDCTASADWEVIVGEAGRAVASTCISARMQTIIVSDLMSAGLSEAEASAMFTFPEALVREIVPIKERILDAIAEEQAAIVDLRRQETLTAIAKEEANRRANDGSGIRLMMDELPDDFTVAEMVSMILANAEKTNAEAFLKAVEMGNPHITVVTGSAVPASVPTTGAAELPDVPATAPSN